MPRILLVEPPFYRLYKNTFSLMRYPLSLGYLAASIKKETDWEVMVYNSDFHPKNDVRSYYYRNSEGFDNYLKNLNNLNYSVWQEIRNEIIFYRPEIIGISSKSQNFQSALNIAKIAKQVDENITVIY